jgi:hypothetical protein
MGVNGKYSTLISSLPKVINKGAADRSLLFTGSHNCYGSRLENPIQVIDAHN